MNQIKDLLKQIIPNDFGEIGTIAEELASVYDNNDGNQNHTISETLLTLINYITNGRLFDYLNQEPSEYPILNTLQQVAKYHLVQAQVDINRNIAVIKNSSNTHKIFVESINTYLMTTSNIFARCIINHLKYFYSKIEENSQSNEKKKETFDQLVILFARSVWDSRSRMTSKFLKENDILQLLYNLLKSVITSHKDVLQSVREVDIQIAIIWAPIFTKSITNKIYDEITDDCVSMTYKDYILKIMDRRNVKIVNYMMEEDTGKFTSTDIRVNPDNGIDIAEELSKTLAGGKIKLLFYILHSLYISILRVFFNFMMVFKLFSVVIANISMTWKGDVSNFDSSNIDSWVSASIPINSLIDSYIMDAPGPLKSAYNTDEKLRTETKIWASGVVFSISRLCLKNQDYITSLINIVNNCLTLKGSWHTISTLWNINKILTRKNEIDFRIKRTGVKRPAGEQPPEKIDGEIQSIPVVLGKHVVRKTQNPIGTTIKNWILDDSDISNVLLSLRRELLSMSIGLFIDNFLTFSGYDYASKVKKLVYLVLKSGLTIYIKSTAQHHDTGDNKGNKYIKYYDPNKYITDFILKLESTSYIKQDIRNANEMFLEGVFAKIVDFTSETKVGMLIDIAFLVDSIIPAYLKFILTTTSSLVAYNMTSFGASKVLLPAIAFAYSFFTEDYEFTDEEKAYYSGILSYVSLGVSLSIGAVSIGRSIKNWWRKGKQTGGYGDMVLYNGKLFEISNSVNEIRSIMKELQVSNFNRTTGEFTIIDKASGEKLVLPLPPNNVNKEDIDENILFATLVNNEMPWDLTTFLLDDINENGQYNVETMRRFVKKLHEYITKQKSQNNSNIHPDIEEIRGGGAIFNFIIDPENGNKYSVKSREGRDILKHYANLIKSTRIIDPSTMESIPLFGGKGNNIFMKYMKIV